MIPSPPARPPSPHGTTRPCSSGVGYKYTQRERDTKGKVLPNEDLQRKLMKRSPVLEIYSGVFRKAGAAASVVVEVVVVVMGMVGVRKGTSVVMSYMKKLRAWGG